MQLLKYFHITIQLAQSVVVVVVGPFILLDFFLFVKILVPARSILPIAESRCVTNEESYRSFREKHLQQAVVSNLFERNITA